MMRLSPRIFNTICLLLLVCTVSAQDSLVQAGADTSSIAAPDSVHSAMTDSAAQVALPWVPIDYTKVGYSKVLESHPWLNFKGDGVYRTIVPKTARNNDGLFYLLLGLSFLLATVKVAFGRYMANLFKVFFRASLKAKQIREQLLQTPLASLLLNIHFIATAALLATFFLLHRQQAEKILSFWWLYAYSLLALTGIYLVKHFVLYFLGWILRIKSTTDTYVFIVFLCNKVLGIFLLPLLMLIAFASEPLVTIAETLAMVLVAGIFLYRYISAYGFVTRELNASRFHFFLYLCAFEVAPLLLIYKVLTKIV